MLYLNDKFDQFYFMELEKKKKSKEEIFWKEWESISLPKEGQ